jgi:hypothetical protein
MIRKFRPVGAKGEKYVTIDQLIQPSLKEGWHLGMTTEQQQKSIENMVNELISARVIEEVIEK